MRVKLISNASNSINQAHLNIKKSFKSDPASLANSIINLVLIHGLEAEMIKMLDRFEVKRERKVEPLIQYIVEGSKKILG